MFVDHQLSVLLYTTNLFLFHHLSYATSITLVIFVYALTEKTKLSNDTQISMILLGLSNVVFPLTCHLFPSKVEIF